MTNPSDSNWLTAIVVSLGDDPRLGTCLTALKEHAPPGTELVLVENDAGADAPVLPLAPAIRIRRSENPGFAAAVEEALSESSGSLVLLLNPDTTLLPGSLQAAMEALESDDAPGAVAFRLLRPDSQTLDSAGICLGFLRRARDRGMGEAAEGRFLDACDVDAACMAGALFRRTALEDARDGAGEIVDTRFFAYKEDVDLGWRLNRAGHRVRYLPSAVALHERGWREGRRRQLPVRLRQLSLRNRWLTILKNESISGLLLRLPAWILVELVVVLYLLIREPRVLKAYPMVLSEFRRSWSRRGPGPGPIHGRHARAHL